MLKNLFLGFLTIFSIKIYSGDTRRDTENYFKLCHSHQIIRIRRSTVWSRLLVIWARAPRVAIMSVTWYRINQVTKTPPQIGYFSMIIRWQLVKIHQKIWDIFTFINNYKKTKIFFKKNIFLNIFCSERYM